MKNKSNELKPGKSNSDRSEHTKSNSNKFIGWAVLLIISFLPVIPWYFLGPSKENLFTYANLTHALGQLAALVGMTMFALTFILSTRMRFIEDAFGGLDKVYKVHSVLGGAALVLILFHPILLVLKFIPSNLQLAAQYLLPGTYLSVNLGVIAFIGLILLLFITFYSQMKYERWKFSHEFLGLVFILAALHIFLVRGNASRDNIFNGYYVYAAIVSLIGILGFLYSLLLKNRMKRASYLVDSITKLKEDVHDIVLSPAMSPVMSSASSPVNKPLNYKAGQFIFLKFDNKKLGKEVHPFSIASKSGNPKIRVLIKNLGDYTNKLDAIKPGDKVSVEGPYGRFNFGRKNVSQIWIAGGIGVTPFIGMAEDLVGAGYLLGKKIELYYSARNMSDLVCLNEFKRIEEKTAGRFRIIPWPTSEKGRLNVEAIIKESGNDVINNNEFYLCGPKELKESLTQALIHAGVHKHKIFSEEFSFR